MEVELDDELLGEFINESREHLTTIEADLLAIEEGGANIDAELVNKVFRAAHSIKGASSFFGLTKVKELAHKAETVLDMMRSKKMTPNAEITNLLLAAFDQLREMINHPAESANADISELVVNLTGLASSYLPQEQKASLTQTVSLQPKGGARRSSLPRFDYERAREARQYLYSVEYDLIHDIERRGRNVLEVFRALLAAGEILDCAVNFEAVGTLDDPIGNQLPLRLIFATASQARRHWSACFLITGTKSNCSPSPAAPRACPEPTATAPPAGDRASAITCEASARSCSPSRAAAQPRLRTASVRPPPKPAAAPQQPRSRGRQHPGQRGNARMLMNLAGELVLGRNQLRASIAQKNPRALKAADQRINQITSELQDVVMQTRLQPIGNVFGKFPAPGARSCRGSEQGHPAGYPRQGCGVGQEPDRIPVGPFDAHGPQRRRSWRGNARRARPRRQEAPGHGHASMPVTKPARWWSRLPTTARASIRSASPRWPWPKG